MSFVNNPSGQRIPQNSPRAISVEPIYPPPQKKKKKLNKRSHKRFNNTNPLINAFKMTDFFFSNCKRTHSDAPESFFKDPHLHRCVVSIKKTKTN